MGAAVLAVAVAGFLGDRSSFAITGMSPATEAASPLDSSDERMPPAPMLGDDGRVPDGVTVFDDHYAAVVNLDPSLLEALRRAATDAARDGVEFQVNSGWRSADYQDELLDDAVAEYGSAEEAARWVATAATSPHVRGQAVDVGGMDATDWLSQHGAGYGLCPVYANEPWHYELRPEAVELGCPGQYADPTEDPRMQG